MTTTIICLSCPGLPWALALGENPRGHEICHHGAILELVFDMVRMVQIGRFKKFLEIVF
jgi:hypothetical protein